MTNDLRITVPSAPQALRRRARFGKKDRFILLAAWAVAVAILAASYFTPWWTFILYAPQYPGGLRLSELGFWMAVSAAMVLLVAVVANERRHERGNQCPERSVRRIPSRAPALGEAG